MKKDRTETVGSYVPPASPDLSKLKKFRMTGSTNGKSFLRNVYSESSERARSDFIKTMISLGYSSIEFDEILEINNPYKK